MSDTRSSPDIVAALKEFRGQMLHEASKTDSCYTCYTDLAAHVARRLDGILAAAQQTRNAVIEECARHIECEADVATNSLHCGDNSQTIAATHRVARAYHEAAKSIRALAIPSTDRCAKCGCETRGEVAWVNNQEWCHPCANAAPIPSPHPAGGK